jgi:hypothetical protein
LRLAVLAGRLDVDRMLSEVSGEQLREWLEFAAIEPFGDRRADYQTALLASVLANVWRGKGQRAAELKDFLLDFRPKEKPNPQKLRNKLLAWASQCQAVDQANKRSG